MKNFWWDWFDGSLAVRERPNEPSFRALFRLWPVRCYGCKRFTLGCREHWFCGYCRVCQRRDEAEDER